MVSKRPMNRKNNFDNLTKRKVKGKKLNPLAVDNVHPFLTPWFQDNSFYSNFQSINSVRHQNQVGIYSFHKPPVTCLVCVADIFWYFWTFFVEFLLLLRTVHFISPDEREEIWHLAPGSSLVTGDGWCLHSAVSPTSHTSTAAQLIPGHVRCCCCDVRTWGTTHTRVLLWWNFTPIVSTNRALCLIIWNIMSK